MVASVERSSFQSGFPYQKPLSQMLTEPPGPTPTVESNHGVATDIRIVCSLGIVSG